MSNAVRCSIGILAGLMMIAAGVAHSFVGWSELRKAFTAAHVPDTLLSGLVVPWQLAGVSMITFGVIVVTTFASGFKGGGVSVTAAVLVGTAYTLFGVIALFTIRMDPFFGAFIVPGVMTVLPAIGLSRNRTDSGAP